jgi:hypothetical protein
MADEDLKTEAAAKTEMGQSIGDVMALSDGQIAMTAHNNQDGTWAVTLGPGGPILEDGLHRDEALAIVGGGTGPYRDQIRNRQELAAADRRENLEANATAHVNEHALDSDRDLGLVDEKGRPILPEEPEPVRVKAVKGGASNPQNARAKNGEEAAPNTRARP